MPIDLKEFERVITEHFKTATEEEVMQNLRKAAPYLFEETPEEYHEDSASILPEDVQVQQIPEIQFSKESLQENATAELVEDAYNCLSQSEKEKFLATILGKASQDSVKVNNYTTHSSAESLSNQIVAE
jgi:hypothetical protein